MRKVDSGKHEARRQAIVEAAKSCFALKGFHQTSTAEICAAAGMSPGNLFHYFPNKKAIIAAIVDQEQAETAAYFETLGVREDLYGALIEFMDVILDMAADADSSSLALEISAEAMRDPDIGARVARNDAELRTALAELLREAAQRGQIDKTLDATSTASWLAALVDGIFNRVAVDADFRPSEQGATMRLLLGRFLRGGERG